MINKIRQFIGGTRLGERWGLSSNVARPRRRRDRRATWRRAAGEVWTLAHGVVCVNGRDVESEVSSDRRDVAQWCQLSETLQEYLDWAFAEESPVFQELASAIHGVQNRLLKKIRRVYDERTSGVTLTWGDGSVLLNNVNVRAILAMYHVRPTDKARRFILGLQQKLALILCQHEASPQVSRAAGAVRDLYHDICTSLTRETIDTRCLPAPAGAVHDAVD